MDWIDYILIGGIAAVFVGVCVYLIKQKKKGKNGCGCGCSGCPHAGACSSHSSAEQKEDE